MKTKRYKNKNSKLNNKQIGMVGLGKMGMALARHAVRDGLEVVAYNRTTSRVDEVVKKGAIGAYSLEKLVEKLEKPRIVWLMVAAGKPIEKVLFGKESSSDSFFGDPEPVRRYVGRFRAGVRRETIKVSANPTDGSLMENSADRSTISEENFPEFSVPLKKTSAELPHSATQGLIDLLEKGDIVIDAVNSHYKDSIRRGRVLLKKGIQFLDVGTSGGVEGALNGACFMIGGPEAAFKKCEPIFKALAKVDGYAYFGKSGSGHFVKMVHNGIEYAMMQALGEGMDILDKSEFDIDLYSTAKVWNHGSIIESRLVDWLQKAIKKDPGLKKSPAEIGSLGTGKWAVEEALELGVPATTIAHAVFSRYQSRNFEALAFKVVQALRAQFGGHTPNERPTQSL